MTTNHIEIRFDVMLSQNIALCFITFLGTSITSEKKDSRVKKNSPILQSLQLSETSKYLIFWHFICRNLSCNTNYFNLVTWPAYTNINISNVTNRLGVTRIQEIQPLSFNN